MLGLDVNVICLPAVLTHDHLRNCPPNRREAHFTATRKPSQKASLVVLYAELEFDRELEEKPGDEERIDTGWMAGGYVRSWKKLTLLTPLAISAAIGPRLPNRYQTAADAIGWKAADMRQFVASRPQLGYVRMVHGQVEIVATVEGSGRRPHR